MGALSLSFDQSWPASVLRCETESGQAQALDHPMIDQPRASFLASQAFDFWQSGRAEYAVPLYEEALTFADPCHYGLPDYHGEFASLLSGLGRFVEAREQFELALKACLNQGASEGSNGVVVARYFLAEHLLSHKEPQLALDTLQPSMLNGIEMEWLLHYSKAFALQALKREEEARAEAMLALETVRSDEKRKELAELFAKGQVL